MSIAGVTTAANGVMASVREAASRTAGNAGWLLATARLESGLNAGAAAATSSARGLFQFTEGTWLAMVRRHGANHGLGWAADALHRGASAAERATILNLRHDPQAASLMAAELGEDNRAALTSRLGRPVDGTDLYLAHFLGAAGAARFLQGMARAPDMAAASLLPAAAAANHSVFYDAGGQPRSLADIHARFSQKLAAAGAHPAAPASSVHAEAGMPLARARMAYLLLAELGA
ncbi:MAG: lytic transglycosylase domain-containing protein [Sphingomonadales bacterium]